MENLESKNSEIKGDGSTPCFICGKVATRRCRCGESECDEHIGRHDVTHFESVKVSNEDLAIPAKSIYEKIDQALEDFDPEKV